MIKLLKQFPPFFTKKTTKKAYNRGDKDTPNIRVVSK